MLKIETYKKIEKGKIKKTIKKCLIENFACLHFKFSI